MKLHAIYLDGYNTCLLTHVRTCSTPGPALRILNRDQSLVSHKMTASGEAVKARLPDFWNDAQRAG
jgi:hypothetical protein